MKFLPNHFKYLLVAAVFTPSLAFAVPVNYFAQLTELNNSGVNGTVNLTIDEDNNSLFVSVSATGLEADQSHIQHIHGMFDASGNPADSLSPTIAQDADGDGFVELAEGLTSYGPILVPLVDAAGISPTAPGGVVEFSQLFDLNDTSIFNTGFDRNDLSTLDLREYVIHGLTVAPGIGAGTDGEVNGEGGYLSVLPVATGEFSLVPAAQVPVPATFGLLAIGLLGLFVNKKRNA